MAAHGRRVPLSSQATRPSDPSTLVKLTGQGDGTTPAALRNVVFLFHSA